MADSTSIPQSVMDKFDADLAIVGVHHKTRAKHETTRAAIVQILCRGLRSRYRLTRYNQRLLRGMTSQCVASAVSKFLKSWTHIDIAVDYSTHETGKHCRMWQLSGSVARKTSILYRPHIMVARSVCLPDSISPVPTPLDPPHKSRVDEASEDVFGRLSHEWCVPVVEYHWPDGWWDSYEDKYHYAAGKLWEDHYDFRPALRFGFESLQDLEPMTYGECYVLADAEVPDDVDDHKNVVRNKAKAWLASWESLRTNGIDWSFRQDGRLYYAIVSLPKVLRRRLRFASGSWVEIDMKSTFWAILVGLIPPGESRDAMLEVLNTRNFYGVINDQLRQPLPASEIKQAVNRDGLFGFRYAKENPYGDTEIFDVLNSLFLECMRYVTECRDRKFGASRLAWMLMKQESKIFIDGGLKWCHQKGIPSLPVHDCLAVPAEFAEIVLEQLRSAATNLLGYTPEFDVEEFGNANHKGHDSRRLQEVATA